MPRCPTSSFSALALPQQVSRWWDEYWLLFKSLLRSELAASGGCTSPSLPCAIQRNLHGWWLTEGREQPISLPLVTVSRTLFLASSGKGSMPRQKETAAHWLSNWPVCLRRGWPAAAWGPKLCQPPMFVSSFKGRQGAPAG